MGFLRSLRVAAKSLQLRNRDGYTLVEVSVSLVAASIVLSGLVIISVLLLERLDIAKDLRIAQEWGNNYVEHFTRDLRNGVNHNYNREVPPSCFEIDVVEHDQIPGPYDAIHTTYSADTVKITYLYDYMEKIPVYKKGRNYIYDVHFDELAGKRSSFKVEPSSFRISRKKYRDERWSDRLNRGNNYDFVTIDFELSYVREPILSIQKSRSYKKYLKFHGSAYVINENWSTYGVYFRETNDRRLYD